MAGCSHSSTGARKNFFHASALADCLISQSVLLDILFVCLACRFGVVLVVVAIFLLLELILFIYLLLYNVTVVKGHKDVYLLVCEPNDFYLI